MAQPDFDIVDPRELLVDEAYQRDLARKSAVLIRRIVEEWRWSKFKPPICVRVDGLLHVIDGQHTAVAAATHAGITAIPVVVVDKPGVADRAKAFVSHARNALPVTPGQVWRAEVAAGDEEALTIKQVCERAGVKLLPFAPTTSTFNTGETIALASIRSLVRRRGARQAREVLRALAKAELAPITGDLVKAGEALLCEDEYRTEFDAERLALTIRTLGPRAQREAKELAAAKCLPLWRALVAVIFKHRKGRPPMPPGTAAPAGATAAVPKGPIQRVIPPAPRRLTVRPPDLAGYSAGDPPPGRSALDQRQATP